MIALYGATGYTGRLVTQELVRRGADFVLGGRNLEKLERLSSQHGGGAEVRVATIDDEASLRALVEGCDVLVNCAGPFTEAGEPVVRAAVATGTHYVDSTGEQPFMKLVFDRYGAEAEARGVALLPAMGFDYVPGDCIARLTADGHEPCQEVEIAYAVRGFGATRGTLRSAFHILKGGDWIYADGEWRHPPRGPMTARFEFPEPIGAQTMVRQPSGEVITVPMHTDTRYVTVLITARTVAPVGPLAPLVPFLQPALSAALRTPLRSALNRVVARLPEGPDEESRRSAEFTIVAIARGADGSEGRGVVRGKDMYGSTAAALVYAAQRMDGGFDQAGPLSPASAFDPAEVLNYLGYAFELERAPVSTGAGV